ncbi:SDR family NAD(P)-dependent oxidoreductase [Ancylobacter sp. MQZ15Z-1]|uniref:SDR family NAD(P)-dependent oxidoreductase n=1 Tax=Ancylobacter mangrovi TaxID=2972472 RepID=A0A9X2PBH8_9HYPH|nr:SDR family NAD(P)-dependent oxidoreductase [Ancylobacter mangrovi]MCS0495581.1 SDR family NAD(P)-dependent oxidoreductase [Ancylobacter mangrovi]
MSKVWFVTGSTRGIGHAIVEAALRDNYRVVATARNPDALHDLVHAYGTSILPIALDVTDPAAAQMAVDAALSDFGRIDVVVNNAGYGNIGSVEDTTLADFRQQIETNLFGTIIVTKAMIPILRQQRSGHIIQFSSVGGRIGAPGRAAYSAAKWGVEGFSEVLAREMALIGVSVTIIEPGGFRTDFAGASTRINQGREEYGAVVGAAARMQRDYDGQQPGDPARAAAAILALTATREPPLRLALGSDAYAAILKADRERCDAMLRWRELSLSTDFLEDD